MTTRRVFLRNLAVGMAASGVVTTLPFSSAGFMASTLADTPDSAKNAGPWIRKTLKIGMVNVPGSLTDKFKAAKQAGFEGIELNAPGLDPDEANLAAQESGLIIDGTVGGYHWSIRHTDPSPDVRAEAMKNLRLGIERTAAVGADTMLLVPGHGKDGTPEEVLQRAKEAVRMAIPDAEKHGVRIVIENVWNEFLYDHQGDSNQTADAHAAFVDSFDSPFVGMQFDLGNHHKYGDVAAWTRTLGKRIMKLDIKGFSRAQNQFVMITEGDIDWGSVRKALVDIGFTGWCAAEVGGGGLDHLKEISENMETALQCSKSVAAVS
jgi:L-ribulose-5-phosphate 3-epimerase